MNTIPFSIELESSGRNSRWVVVIGKTWRSTVQTALSKSTVIRLTTGETGRISVRAWNTAL